MWHVASGKWHLPALFFFLFYFIFSRLKRFYVDIFENTHVSSAIDLIYTCIVHRVYDHLHRCGTVLASHSNVKIWRFSCRAWPACTQPNIWLRFDIWYFHISTPCIQRHNEIDEWWASVPFLFSLVPPPRLPATQLWIHSYRHRYTFSFSIRLMERRLNNRFNWIFQPFSHFVMCRRSSWLWLKLCWGRCGRIETIIIMMVVMVEDTAAVSVLGM